MSNRFTISDIQKPTMTAPNDVTFECSVKTPQGVTNPDLGTSSATDLCDESLIISSNRPRAIYPDGVNRVHFPLGKTTVTYTATDDSGNSGTDTQDVTVVDTTAPSLTVPSNVIQECSSPLGTPVTLGTASVSDLCWATVSVSNNAPSLFPLGATTVNWTAVDGSTNSSTLPQTVTVRDTTPPNLTVTLTPNVLKPNDHKLKTVRANITLDDGCDASPTVRLISIISSEPDNASDDGNTLNDIQGASFGTDDREFLLRAERSGVGTTRIYTVTYRATDASGNATTKVATVTVPIK